MKVKNIMFAGFAAAIFASVAGAANAAPTYELASKQYVDAEIETLGVDVNSKVDHKQGVANAGKGMVVDDQGVLVLTDVATDAELSAAIANEVERANGAYDEKNAAADALRNANDYTDTLTGDVASLKTDENLKAAKGSTDLTDAVKKLDAAITVASGDLSNVYTKDQTNALLADKVDQRQDVANAGKGLIVNSEGVLAIADVATDTELSDAKAAAIDAAAADATSKANAAQAAAEATAAADATSKANAAQAAAEATAAADATSKANAAQAAAEATAAADATSKADKAKEDAIAAAEGYTNAEIAKVNSSAAWLDKTAEQKGDYIVRVDENGNESLINVVVIDANGKAIYPAPAAN